MNSRTKKIMVFVLIAVIICLLANINQLIGLLMNDFPRPPRHHHRPPDGLIKMQYRLTGEIILSLVVSFGIMTFNSGMLIWYNAKKKLNQPLVITISTVVAFLLFFLLFLAFMPDRRPSRMYFLLLSKVIFVVVVSISAGQLYRLIWQKQQVELENEQLKTDNIESRYMVLMDQVNPHFLFNSLNSLAYLIRESQQEKALTFIDELSSIFRYVLQKRSNELVTLHEEILFTEAYRYLLDIRYEHKLFFEIKITEEDMLRKLPFLSLQPLIENAVKHNAISSKQPLAIFIYTLDGMLVVSNPIISKISTEKSTGIGLSNLSHRYQLLTGKNITIDNDGKTFIVKIPLI